MTLYPTSFFRCDDWIPIYDDLIVEHSDHIPLQMAKLNVLDSSQVSVRCTVYSVNSYLTTITRGYNYNNVFHAIHG